MTTLRILGGGAVHGLVDAARGPFAAASGDAIATRAPDAAARLVAMLTDAAGAEARRGLGFA